MEIQEELLRSCLFSTAACAAFAVQFNIRPKHLLLASAGGFISQIIFSFMDYLNFGEMTSTFAAAAAAALFSEILARGLHVPANMYLIVSIIPLVPGGMLYSTMYAFIMHNSETGADLALRTIGVAGAIAMGIFVVSSFFRIAGIARTKRSKKRRCAERK
ncbi:MAG: threonine/serine exporter family protein [Oscillospiraceae bacterium]